GGFKRFSYPGVGFVTSRAISYGFLVMQMFYNPSKASIVGIFPSSSSALCRLPCALPRPRSPKVAKNQFMLTKVETVNSNKK
ncbi:hypothetical protein, partial [Nostoc sp. 'Peltigera malacea cyanobiont' DB3992]|uniref:hypothetical protein n=1 Tax=Nostoc sp. 'Peltigera malacea cyanobiont' DB3992 TaxID=1206980 RepID=UPI00211ECCBB